jgi:hypothetical protein
MDGLLFLHASSIHGTKYYAVSYPMSEELPNQKKKKTVYMIYVMMTDLKVLD